MPSWLRSDSLNPQDVGVELDGPLDVRNMEQDMADLARANRCRHDFSFRSHCSESMGGRR